MASPYEMTGHPVGVNVAGYLKTESGVGQWGRLVAATLEAAGEPYAVNAYERTILRQEHGSDVAPDDSWGRFDTTLVVVNADQLPFFVEDAGPVAFAEKHVAGLWAWEVEAFPAAMAASSRFVDEVWALSQHAADAIAPQVTVPVRTVPCPVEPARPEELDVDPSAGASVFTFLFAFDFYSVIERKNPFGVIEAFRKAFPASDDVRLVVKSVNGDRHPELLARVHEAASGDSRVDVRDGYVSAADHRLLVRSCHGYVSLHRAEGFGFTMAEAMSFGKPVIATGYSGNLEFMTDENSFLVPFRRVPIGPGNEPYPAEASWAEPDVDAAVDALRVVAAGGADVDRRAQRARVDIERCHTPRARSPLVLDRLAALREMPVGGHGLVPTEVSAEPVAPASRPEPSAESTSPDRLAELRSDARRLAGAVRRRVVTAAGARKDARPEEPVDAETAPSLHIERASHARDLALSHRIEGLADEIDSRVTALEVENFDLRRLVGQLRSDLDELRERSQVMRHQLEDLWELVDAVPYMSEARSYVEKDEHGRPRLGFSRGEATSGVDRYAAFEDVFRGSESEVRERMRVYVDVLRGADPVIDVGCGRGELLDVLREAGVEAVGVDADEGMVRRARARGLDVVLDDALTYLEGLDAASVGAVFSAQVIEHLDPAVVRQLVEAAVRVLRPGGTMILETVNPHSLRALKTFWIDPTHVHPVYPESLLFECDRAGFSDGRVVFPHGMGDLHRDRRWEGEFAVIATR